MSSITNCLRLKLESMSFRRHKNVQNRGIAQFRWVFPSFMLTIWAQYMNCSKDRHLCFPCIKNSRNHIELSLKLRRAVYCIDFRLVPLKTIISFENPINSMSCSKLCIKASKYPHDLLPFRHGISQGRAVEQLVVIYEPKGNI